MKSDKLDKDKKRKILFENFNNPTFQVSLKKLQELKQNLNIPFFTFKSSDRGCGDIIYLSMKFKENYIEYVFFATDQQACCLTVSAANIFCNWIKNKKKEEVELEITNFEKMIKENNQQILRCENLKVFQDLNKFPSRLECINLVVRAIKHFIH